METEETIANIINVARKNAALLCRNKWNPTNTKDNVLCYNSESENGYPINLNLSNNNYAGKTIVVKGRDITISNSMKIEDKPINIFIDQGNLYLQNPISTGNLQDFNAYGFPILSTDPS